MDNKPDNRDKQGDNDNMSEDTYYIYYELFFDGDEINRFWGTAETFLGNDVYELCEQPFYIKLTDEMINECDLDPEVGVADNEEMQVILERFFTPEITGCDADLVNCVYPETAECLFAFHEIDGGDFVSATGIGA